MTTTIADAFAAVNPAILGGVTKDSDPLHLGEATHEHLRGLVRTVQSSYHAVSWADAEEATGEAIVRVAEKAHTLKSGSPWGLVVQKARWLLISGFAAQRRVQSIEGLYASAGDDAFYGARPARPDSPTMRRDLTPEQRELAESLILWRDREGRSPTAADCERCADLPSPSTMTRLFGTYNSALLACGLHPNLTKRRYWTKEEADDVLLRFRREHGCFPTSCELTADAGLPNNKTMQRFYGSSSPRKYGPKILSSG